jgi:hypothetical protein
MLFAIVGVLVLAPVAVFATTHVAPEPPKSIWNGAACAPDNMSPTKACGLCDAIVVTSNIFRFLIQLGIYAATIYIVYGGIMMMVSGGDEARYKAGKAIIKRTLIGLAWILGAWLIVNTLFKFLVKDPNKDPWNKVSCVATVR